MIFCPNSYVCVCVWGGGGEGGKLLVATCVAGGTNQTAKTSICVIARIQWCSLQSVLLLDLQ